MDWCTPFTFVIAFLHLLFIENRGAVIIPVTTKTMLADITMKMAIESHKNKKKFTNYTDEHSPAELYQGLQNDVLNYMFSWPLYQVMPSPFDNSNKFSSQGGLLEASFGDILPKINWAIWIWVLVFVIYLLIGMIRDGITDFSDGRYFYFTWQLEKKYFFLSMTYGLLTVSMLLFSGFCLYVILLCESVSFANTMGNGIVTFCSWLFGVVSVLRTRRPCFRWKDEFFKEMKFKRSWSNCLITNDLFAQYVQAALVKSHRQLLKESSNPVKSPGGHSEADIVPIPEGSLEQGATSGLLRINGIDRVKSAEFPKFKISDYIAQPDQFERLFDAEKGDSDEDQAACC
eukprot:TRINITY_DN106014_c0_g1_i1.p1 TRINITY_DN106014_c0_g1~~TRINITY_DN106014_c0_g1_i1.p1  ORF type:complete len:353 (-),score=54.04 TRINITY_DN106014_c0_g1_i1:60-1091(-)